VYLLDVERCLCFEDTIQSHCNMCFLCVCSSQKHWHISLKYKCLGGVLIHVFGCKCGYLSFIKFNERGELTAIVITYEPMSMRNN
jgi:hypothetical protein